MLDDTDKHILKLLQENARLSNADIAEQVGLTTSTVFERIKKLQNKGIIQRMVAIVEPEAVGKPITAFVRLTVGTQPEQSYRESKQSFAETCLTEPAVLECHSVAGADCYILKVRVSTPKALETLLERLRNDNAVASSVSSIVLSTVKETTFVEPF